MDMILLEMFLKSINLIPQEQIIQMEYLYNNVSEQSNPVESGGNSSKNTSEGIVSIALQYEVLLNYVFVESRRCSSKRIMAIRL